MNKKILVLIIIAIFYAVGFWQLHQKGSKKSGSAYLPAKETSSGQEGPKSIWSVADIERPVYPKNDGAQSATTVDSSENNIPRPVAWDQTSPEAQEPLSKSTNFPADNTQSQDNCKESPASKIDEAKVEPPSPTVTEPPTTAPYTVPVKSENMYPYRIQKGDALWGMIAKFYNLKDPQQIKSRLKQVVKCNSWLDNPDHLPADAILYFPYDNEPPLVSSAVDENETILLQTPFALGEKKEVCYIVHVVAKGETYHNIAEKYYHDRTKWLCLYEANPQIDPKVLECGIQIKVPMIK